MLETDNRAVAQGCYNRLVASRPDLTVVLHGPDGVLAERRVEGPDESPF